MYAAEPRVLGIRDRDVPVARLAVAAVAFAGALALAAQVRIPLPFTPVPITLQTLVLYLGGAWLGARVGIAGLALYVGAAVAGMPVMAGFRGGLAAFTGATGGYIVGWFLAVLLLGGLLHGSRVRAGRAVGLLAAASALILFCGALHLGLLLGLTPWQAFLMGVAPFLPGDALKILLAAAVVRRWPSPMPIR